jgi:hypothetical protein
MAPLTWEEVATIRPSRVWVTTEDQAVVEVSGPQMFGDTLVGYVGGDFQELPTSDIKQVVVKRAAKGKTMALVAASIAGGAAIAVVISGAGARPKFEVNCDDYDPGEHPDCP